MSSNRAGYTSSSVAIVFRPETIYFPKNSVFIRRLKADDAREVTKLLEMSEYVIENENPQFGIFNDSGQLVGMYETSAEAFLDSVSTEFTLQWIH